MVMAIGLPRAAADNDRRYDPNDCKQQQQQLVTSACDRNNNKTHRKSRVKTRRSERRRRSRSRRIHARSSVIKKPSVTVVKPKSPERSASVSDNHQQRQNSPSLDTDLYWQSISRQIPTSLSNNPYQTHNSPSPDTGSYWQNTSRQVPTSASSYDHQRSYSPSQDKDLYWQIPSQRLPRQMRTYLIPTKRPELRRPYNKDRLSRKRSTSATKTAKLEKSGKYKKRNLWTRKTSRENVTKDKNADAQRKRHDVSPPNSPFPQRTKSVPLVKSHERVDHTQAFERFKELTRWRTPADELCVNDIKEVDMFVHSQKVHKSSTFLRSQKPIPTSLRSQNNPLATSGNQQPSTTISSSQESKAASTVPSDPACKPVTEKLYTQPSTGAKISYSTESQYKAPGYFKTINLPKYMMRYVTERDSHLALRKTTTQEGEQAILIQIPNSSGLPEELMASDDAEEPKKREHEMQVPNSSGGSEQTRAKGNAEKPGNRTHGMQIPNSSGVSEQSKAKGNAEKQRNRAHGMPMKQRKPREFKSATSTTETVASAEMSHKGYFKDVKDHLEHIESDDAYSSSSLTAPNCKESKEERRARRKERRRLLIANAEAPVTQMSLLENESKHRKRTPSSNRDTSTDIFTETAKMTQDMVETKISKKQKSKNAGSLMEIVRYPKLKLPEDSPTTSDTLKTQKSAPTLHVKRSHTPDKHKRKSKDDAHTARNETPLKITKNKPLFSRKPSRSERKGLISTEKQRISYGVLDKPKEKNEGKVESWRRLYQELKDELDRVGLMPSESACQLQAPGNSNRRLTLPQLPERDEVFSTPSHSDHSLQRSVMSVGKKPSRLSTPDAAFWRAAATASPYPYKTSDTEIKPWTSVGSITLARPARFQKRKRRPIRGKKRKGYRSPEMNKLRDYLSKKQHMVQDGALLLPLGKFQCIEGLGARSYTKVPPKCSDGFVIKTERGFCCLSTHDMQEMRMMQDSENRNISGSTPVTTSADLFSVVKVKPRKRDTGRRRGRKKKRKTVQDKKRSDKLSNLPASSMSAFELLRYLRNSMYRPGESTDIRTPLSKVRNVKKDKLKNKNISHRTDKDKSGLKAKNQVESGVKTMKQVEAKVDSGLPKRVKESLLAKKMKSDEHVTKRRNVPDKQAKSSDQLQPEKFTPKNSEQALIHRTKKSTSNKKLVANTTSGSTS